MKNDDMIVHEVKEHYGFLNETLLDAIYGRCKHCRKTVFIKPFYKIPSIAHTS